MDLFFEIQRSKTHIFCDAKDTATVLELKKIIEGILKISPSDQLLKKESEGGKQWAALEEDKRLSECGFTTGNAKAQQPAVIALCCRTPEGQFEEVNVESLSIPPPLPDVMRSAQESAPSGSSVPADVKPETIA